MQLTPVEYILTSNQQFQFEPSAERLQKPTLNKTYKSEEVGCRLWLLCSSTDNGVDVSWQGEAPGVTVFNKLNPDGNSAILVAFLKTTQDSANFTCTSSKNTEKASTNVTLKCDGKVTMRKRDMI